MKESRFRAVPLIQQTVMKELRRYKKRFLGHSIHCMGDANVVQKHTGTTLTGCVNKYFFSFFVWFYDPSLGGT
jgi:hypothetical protein